MSYNALLKLAREHGAEINTIDSSALRKWIRSQLKCIPITDVNRLVSEYRSLVPVEDRDYYLGREWLIYRYSKNENLYDPSRLEVILSHTQELYDL